MVSTRHTPKPAKGKPSRPSVPRRRKSKHIDPESGIVQYSRVFKHPLQLNSTDVDIQAESQGQDDSDEDETQGLSHTEEEVNYLSLGLFICIEYMVYRLSLNPPRNESR